MHADIRGQASRRSCCSGRDGIGHAPRLRTLEPAQVIEHVISTLTEDSGAIRTRHGDRLGLLLRPGRAAFGGGAAPRDPPISQP